MSLESSYENDASSGPGLVSLLAFIVAFTVIAVAATIGLTHTSELREAARVDAVAIREDSEDGELNPVTAEQPRVVAYIVSSKRGAFELDATLTLREALAYEGTFYEPIQASYSILVAETREQAQAWKASLDMAASEGVLVAIYDLTLE